MAQWQGHRARAEGITQLAEVFALVTFNKKLLLPRQKLPLLAARKQKGQPN
jgi:hypothetical protein